MKLPVNFDRNPVNPSGVVRPVADAMMVRVPAVVVLTSVELRSIDSGSVTRVLTSTFVLNVPNFLTTTASGSVLLVVDHVEYPASISSMPRMGSQTPAW